MRQLQTTLSRCICLTFTVLISVLCSAQQPKSEQITLEGQLVCSECWFEADRNVTPYGTDADISCARDCAAKGIPPAIAVKEGETYKLYFVEGVQAKKGTADWLNAIGKQVKVSGQIRAVKNKSYIAVDKLSVVASAVVSNPQIGTQAELALKDLFGVEQNLISYRGRILILNFWATWCVPCRAEMPELMALQNDYAAFGVQVVGASADELSERQKVVGFIKETRLNFPIWLGLSSDDMKRFGVGPSLPATIVISREGKILAVYPNVIKAVEVRRRIDELLASADASIKQQIASAKRVQRDVSLVPS